MHKNKNMFFFLFLFSCQKSNLFKDKNDTERSDYLFQKASILFDEEKFDEAYPLAEKAKILNKDNEEIYNLLANIYLSKSGYKFFDVIKDIIEKQKKENETKNSSDLLGSFNKTFSLNDEEKTIISTKNISNNSFFNGLDLYIPKIPGDISDTLSPRSTIKKLLMINNLIKETCPFIIDKSILEEIKTENSRYSCLKRETVENDGAFYFIYGLGHLIEAVLFYEILSYETPGLEPIPNQPEIKGNLSRRAFKLKEITVNQENIDDYVDAVDLLKSDVDKVLDEETKNSMINETTQNFRIAATSFAAIKGMPKSISNGIIKQLDNLNKKNQTEGENQTMTGTFKGEMNETLVNQLKESIENLPEDIDSEKLNKVCNSFAHIAQTSSITKPTKCL